MSEFEQRLQKAIDDTFTLLGPVGKRTLCVVLKQKFGLGPNELSADPDRLSSALDQIFGGAGQVLGRAIARKVAATYSIELRQDRGLTYADHIRQMRQIARDPSLHTGNCAGTGDGKLLTDA